ncbi:MAG: FimV/HubP family polar landmark protein, partial [Candidatus Methylumidiphilus sp.]
MRKISKTLALMGFFAPWGVFALGIGDIRLNSALNEPLNAEIPLVSSGADELSDVRVKLASPEAFARANVERTYELTTLRFTPQKQPYGSYVIKIRSKDVIREPYLDFMIEVYWPQGRLQREFTVLLDPPDSLREARAADAELPEAEFYRRPGGQTERFAPSSNSIPRQQRPSARANRPRQMASMPIESEQPMPVTGAEYGPIGRNETLWGIAKRVQNPPASQRQTLIAIYKANPHAFYKSNINALKAGATITIPDQASIARLAGPAASPRHVVTSANPKPVMADTTEDTGSRGQLQLLAPSESKSLDESATSGKKGKAGKSKEDLTIELADTARQESENFSKRLADTEKQLAAMQKLLSLKDEQIASLQNQQKPLVNEGQPHVPLSTAQPTPAPPIAVTSNPATAKSTEPPLTALQAPALPPSNPPIPLSQTAAQSTQKPPVSERLETIRPKTPAPKPVTPPVQPKAAEPSEEGGMFSELLGQPLYLVAGATVLLLLPLFWLYKRRRSEMVDNTESILTLAEKEKAPQAQPKPALEPTNVYPNVTEQSPAFRSSFLSEFSPSDFDALGGEMEDVDPISEADVYLAYGRYKQAEDLILAAIAQNQEREDCRLKLFEIHYTTENAQAFEKCAEELAPTHQDSKPEFWEKVVEMGREICPGNPLFKGGKPSASPDSFAKQTAP